MSSVVVIHDETLIRMAGLPFHTVPPHQQVPSSWISCMILFVSSASPKQTRTWFKDTTLRISNPAFCRLAANNLAHVQHLSINSTTPSLPSEYMAAHVSIPLARLDISGVLQ